MHDGAEKASAPDAGHAAPPPLSPRAALAGASDPEAASALDDRISSGEFTDAGSTKERISRPVRKFFALDPVGPGKEERGELGESDPPPTPLATHPLRPPTLFDGGWGGAQPCEP